MTPDLDELTWVADNRLDVPDPDGAMTDRARMALVQHMSAESQRPRRRLPWLAGASACAAVAAGAVVVFAGAAGAGPHHGTAATPTADVAPTSGTPSYVLLKVARSAARTLALPGNATLVKRTTQIVQSGRPTTYSGFDLYEDDGKYFYGSTLTALRATAGDPSPGEAQDAPLGQVVAAAAASANLTPAQAAEKLLAADPHPTPHVGETDTTGGHTYTWTQAAVNRDLEGIEWQAISAALEGGAGQPQVRAGALQAAAGLPHTTVTNTTVDGQPATEVSFDQGPTTGVESLTVDSATGILLAAHSGAGTAGGAVSDTTYEVSRVTAPSLAPAS